jgi:HAD superfamily hydrolase (TIGR01509 family)
MEKVILVDAINTLIKKDIGVDFQLQNILDVFPNKKIILTNANDEQITEFLQNMPYELFTLKHNPEKTDGGYYEKFLEEYNLKPEQCLYIEHNKEAFEKAKELGIKTLWFDKEKRDLEEIELFLQNNLNN